MKPFERPKTEKNGEQWLPDHPWCPNGQIDYGISEVKKEGQGVVVGDFLPLQTAAHLSQAQEEREREIYIYIYIYI